MKSRCPACCCCRYRELDELFATGVSVHSCNEFGVQCIHKAAQHGHKKVAKTCLRWGAHINARDGHGQTPLHYAYANHHGLLADYLASKGADEEAVNREGLIPSQLWPGRK